MTVTKTDDAEEVSAAKRRAQKIGLRLDIIADNFEALVPLIQEALELRDYETLGYQSPGDYLTDQFGASLARLPVEIRRETVAAIDSVQKVSNRSLAPVFDVDQATISRDRQAIASGVAGATGAADSSASSDDEPSIGTDGKEYPRPKRSKPRKRPYEERAQVQMDALMKAIDGVEALANEDPERASAWVTRLSNQLDRGRRIIDLIEDRAEGDDETDDTDATPWRNGGGDPDPIQRANWAGSFESFKAIIETYAENLTGERLAEFGAYLASVADRSEGNGEHADERPGGTNWSRQVQRISATIPMELLTVEEVEELEEVVEFLHDRVTREWTIREVADARSCETSEVDPEEARLIAQALTRAPVVAGLLRSGEAMTKEERSQLIEELKSVQTRLEGMD